MPAVRALPASLIAFLCGVLLAGFDLPLFWLVAALLLAPIVTSFFSRELLFACAAVLCCAVGIAHYRIFIHLQNTARHVPLSMPVRLEGLVIEEPKLFEGYQQIWVRLDHPYTGDIQVRARPSPAVAYGDKLEMDGSVLPPQTTRDPPMAVYPRVRVVQREQGNWLKQKLLAFKHRIIDAFRGLLPSESAALMSGILLGYQGDFTREFRGQMAGSGTTHIVALSGYNIAILVTVLGVVLKRFFSRTWVVWLTAIGIGLFVLMVGAEASVVRAAAMGSLALLAQAAGRPYWAGRAVIITAAIMVIIDPLFLGFDVGFQLSFASLLGIMYLKPLLDVLLNVRAESGFMGWKESLTTTASAQLAVAPLLLYYFGQFTPLSLLANLLILEFMPATMLLGFILALAALISSWLAELVALPAALLLAYERTVIAIGSRFAIVAPPAVLWVMLGSSYAVLIWLMKKRGVFAAHRTQ